jgi:HrpA-like RNA helicase
MGVPLGREVGYAVRFESREIGEFEGKVGKGKRRTNVRFCTEGVLLRCGGGFFFFFFFFQEIELEDE